LNTSASKDFLLSSVSLVYRPALRILLIIQF